jgi:hypothetical protein
MKKKETVDDRLIKDVSTIDRVVKKDDFPETEDPERYAKQKQLKKEGIGKHLKEKKKETREDREKNENARRAFVERRNNGANGQE